MMRDFQFLDSGGKILVEVTHNSPHTSYHIHKIIALCFTLTQWNNNHFRGIKFLRCGFGDYLTIKQFNLIKEVIYLRRSSSVGFKI